MWVIDPSNLTIELIDDWFCFDKSLRLLVKLNLSTLRDYFRTRRRGWRWKTSPFCEQLKSQWNEFTKKLTKSESNPVGRFRMTLLLCTALSKWKGKKTTYSQCCSLCFAWKLEFDPPCRIIFVYSGWEKLNCLYRAHSDERLRSPISLSMDDQNIKGIENSKKINGCPLDKSAPLCHYLRKLSMKHVERFASPPFCILRLWRKSCARLNIVPHKSWSLGSKFLQGCCVPTNKSPRWVPLLPPVSPPKYQSQISARPRPRPPGRVHDILDIMVTFSRRHGSQVCWPQQPQSSLASGRRFHTRPQRMGIAIAMRCCRPCCRLCPSPIASRMLLWVLPACRPVCRPACRPAISNMRRVS